MAHDQLLVLAGIAAAGVVAQWLAWRLRMPAILFLLICGIVTYVELMQRMGELDPTREHVVYCRSGSRSAWATLVLRQSGFENVINLKGGVLAWREEW